MRISQRLFIRFWTCIYDYIPCFMRSMSILLCPSLTGWVRHFLPRNFEYCSLSGNLQKICGSTWWLRASKQLFSAGWSHMPHLEWENDRNRKLFWWPDYFESLMAAKISWLKSSRFFPGGAPWKEKLMPTTHAPYRNWKTTFDVKLLRLVRTSSRPLSQTWNVPFSSAWTVVANISSISSSIDMLLMKQGM